MHAFKSSPKRSNVIISYQCNIKPRSEPIKPIKSRFYELKSGFEIVAIIRMWISLIKVFQIKFDIFRISKTLGIFFSPHFALQFFKKSNFPTLDVCNCTYVAVHFQANCDRTHQNMEHFFYKFVLDTVFILPNYCGCLEYTTRTDNFLVHI